MSQGLTGHKYYDDIQGVLGTALVGVTQYTPIQLRNTGIVVNRLDQGDTFTMLFQMPHRRSLGEQQHDVHIHFMPLSSATGTVKLDVKWGWINIGETVPDTLPNQVNGSYGVSLSLAPADQWLHKYTELVEHISKAGETYSSVLMLHVTRGGGPQGDTYPTGVGAGIAILYCDSHFPTDRLGSYYEISDR